MDYDHNDPLMIEETLADWVLQKRDAWRNHFDANYKEKYDEYYRLWRGEWAAEDKTRDSERSRLISPAIMQAVEENAAEVEEATFGRGNWFDIRDDVADQDPTDIQNLSRKLHEDMNYTQTKVAISECILNAAVYGTGIAEVMLDEVKDQKPASQPMMGGELVAVGVNVRDRMVVRLRPVLPQNCLNDPNATTVDNGVGVILDEYTGKEAIEILQEKGVYRDVDIGEATIDSALEATQDLVQYQDDRIRITKYFGLVPRDLLDDAMADDEAEDAELVELTSESQDGTSRYVEAIVVLGNDVILKAQKNPYMMQDRPVVAFPWDIVPGRFQGRGVVEKGYNAQKALDAEIRARVDALALTIHPMLAVDATRMPRGAKPVIAPGKMIKTQGDPNQILMPFNFGRVDQITFAQAAELQKMVQQATGAVNAAGLPNAVAGGEAGTGAMSMALGAVLKRHKRTLQFFQGMFLIPVVSKFAWRYMQFDPEGYPVGDYKFNAEGSLGSIAREYEVQQLIQLLQTVGQDSPMYPIILNSVVENMSLTRREELLAALKQAQQPDPKQQQMQEQMHQQEMALKDGSIALLTGQAHESEARAVKYMADAKAVPEQTELRFQEMQFEQVRAASENMDSSTTQDDKNFERRLKILSELRADRKVQIEEKRADTDAKNAISKAASQAKSDAALGTALNG